MIRTPSAIPDVLVLGGGRVGSAVAWGLAREGMHVSVLDQGDGAFRASRGNFGLVWIQGKGYGLPPYARWSRSSATRWPAPAAALLARRTRQAARHAATRAGRLPVSAARCARGPRTRAADRAGRDRRELHADGRARQSAQAAARCIWACSSVA
ncbi:FAD-dependent oxidoreductase [Paraburkholderia phenoliruptrix]|uniref:FAD dependent oxidoreductase n=1 Tax=Paraburkholderia phenoliruptrix BR3459a TaxID=1229205 RepID=K0E2H4_9BURK|nr:FAD dependent oxidoreductase [Paraburkholderia phenoliruptrix BR3459a]